LSVAETVKVLQQHVGYFEELKRENATLHEALAQQRVRIADEIGALNTRMDTLEHSTNESEVKTANLLHGIRTSTALLLSEAEAVFQKTSMDSNRMTLLADRLEARASRLENMGKTVDELCAWQTTAEAKLADLDSARFDVLSGRITALETATKTDYSTGIVATVEAATAGLHSNMAIALQRTERLDRRLTAMETQTAPTMIELQTAVDAATKRADLAFARAEAVAAAQESTSIVDLTDSIQEELIRLHNAVAGMEATKADMSALKPLRRLASLAEEIHLKADRTDLQALQDMVLALAEMPATRTVAAVAPAPPAAEEIGLTGAITKSSPLHCLTCDGPLPRTEPREVGVVSRVLPGQGSNMPRILYRIRPGVRSKIDYASKTYCFSRIFGHDATDGPVRSQVDVARARRPGFRPHGLTGRCARQRRQPGRNHGLGRS
jgi:hypothetical protein